MEITLNEKDREFIINQCVEKMHDKIMKALVSDAGYNHMADEVKRWVNLYTDESMMKSLIRDEINVAVKRQVIAMFTSVANSPTAKELVKPVRDTVQTIVSEEIAKIVERITED